MPKSTQEEKYRWIKPIFDKNITIKNLVQVCPFRERTIKYWLFKYREDGLNGLTDKSKRPKTSPNETPIHIKEEIIRIRKDSNLCAKKINFKLRKRGIIINSRTIGKIIK